MSRRSLGDIERRHDRTIAVMTLFVVATGAIAVALTIAYVVMGRG